MPRERAFNDRWDSRAFADRLDSNRKTLSALLRQLSPILYKAYLPELEGLDRDEKHKRRRFEEEEESRFSSRPRPCDALPLFGIKRRTPYFDSMPPLYGQSERAWAEDDDAQGRPSKRRRTEKDDTTSQGYKSRRHHDEEDGDGRYKTDRTYTSRFSRSGGIGGKTPNEASSTKWRRTEKDDTTSQGRESRRYYDKGDDDEYYKTDRTYTSRASRSGGVGGRTPNEASSTKQHGPDDDDIFREALFDALSDPEGAEYWEKLYGQPIHVYPRPVVVNPETGKRELVTDGEYVAYVRRKMWEKTHEGYLESRRKRMEEQGRRLQEEFEQREAEERRKADDRRRKEAQRRMEERLDRALRQAEKRRQTQTEGLAFADYVARWNTWDGDQATIPWPTKNGSSEGITERDVRSFFLRGLNLKGLGTGAFNAKLKEHRVRWHPDKMQQKMGGRAKVDGDTMADITMTFQVIDTLYNDTRQTK